MNEEQGVQDPQPDIDGDGSSSTADKSRIRSTIVFPYGSLKDAEQIAEALHSHWGGEASPDQLAGSLGSAPRSGTFRVKVATARIFGAVNVRRGKVSLTDLGHQLVDPDNRDEARIEAFLSVPLFQAIFEEYKGKSLPPDAGLEQKITDLGVSAKQKDKARQALRRSAERAGFFKTQKGRLIRPAANGSSGKTPAGPSGQDKVSPPQSGQVDAPLANLWLTLLDQGEDWSAAKTHDFVKAARELRKIMASEG